MRLAALIICLAGSALADVGPDIVILGEVHDNPDAHLGQAAALADLQPTAVVFEMLTHEEAQKADADRSRIEEAWTASGWRDFPIYAPIFDALGAARIIGAAAPRDTIWSVYSDGPAGLFGPDAPLYGLDVALSADQQDLRETLQFEAHCQAMPIEMMAGMVDVQRYRDAVFARAALEALETFGPLIAIVAGNGHARTDWGIPAQIARVAPKVTTHAIAFVKAPTDTPFDEIRIVPETERDDPCASLTSN
ncbi:ChaN family lipoprotein [Antarctobacter jejuensis]|uniref:ChaN family lipoprotein n=1 Tax=Antarctobacter jejuensis TaxID=1439938 RepID=UPI003FCF16BF